MPVIGEGTYGCVHKPSLKCDTTDIVDYTNKISKLLIKKEAENEIKEYSTLNKIDKNEKHYIGMPIKCKVNNDNQTMSEISKCGNADKFRDLNNSRLLIMNDGGSNLSDIFNSDFKSMSNEEKITTSELIVVFMCNVFNSIQFFIKNKVYHRDIKLENIVFNLKERQINIIDFGLMDNKNNLFSSAINNKYKLDVVWWSLAPYSLFINKQNFLNMHIIQRNNGWYNNFLTTNQLHNGKQINYLFKRITRKNNLNKSSVKSKLIAELKSEIEKLPSISHEKYIENVFNLLDVHNLGIIMLELAGYIKTYVKNNDLIKNIINLGLKMISFTTFDHITIDESLSEYKEILNKSKLLEKHKFKIVNNEIVKMETQKSFKPEKYPLVSVLDKLNTNIIRLQTTKDKTNILKSPIKKSTTSKKVRFTSPLKKTSKKTPSGKIRNPSTGRLINIPKTTPPGKMLNPKTGRYINIPKPTREISDITRGLSEKQTKMLKKFIYIIKNNKGKNKDIRIITGKDTRKKTSPNKMRNHKSDRVSKPKTQTQKKTPPGKMRNPKTGRFINKPKTQTQKKTPPGKMRNPKTGRFINIPKNQTQKKITVKKVNKTQKEKKCSPGKIINPETGRCVEEFKKRRFIFFN